MIRWILQNDQKIYRYNTQSLSDDEKVSNECERILASERSNSFKCASSWKIINQQTKIATHITSLYAAVHEQTRQ